MSISSTISHFYPFILTGWLSFDYYLLARLAVIYTFRISWAKYCAMTSPPTGGFKDTNLFLPFPYPNSAFPLIIIIITPWWRVRTKLLFPGIFCHCVHFRILICRREGGTKLDQRVYSVREKIQIFKMTLKSAPEKTREFLKMILNGTFYWSWKGTDYLNDI